MSKLLPRVRKGLVGLGVLVSLLIAVLPAKNVYAATDAEITAQIDEIKSKIDKKYWNKHKTGRGRDILFEVTDGPCKGNSIRSETCDSNKFGGSGQCEGFARALTDYLFGSDYLRWKSDTDISYVRPGDVVYTKKTDGKEHKAVVWKVESDGRVQFAECWGGKAEEYHENNCRIAFGIFNGTYSTLEQIAENHPILAIYRHPGSTVPPASASNSKTNTTPTISLSGEKSPTGILKQGSNFGLRGVFRTNVGTISITGGVYYADGTPVKGYVKSYSKGTKSIDIRSTLNNYVIFNNLPAGNYKYIVTATAKNGNKTKENKINTSFTVQGKGTAQTVPASSSKINTTPKISLSGEKSPTGILKQGNNFGLRGIFSTNVGTISIIGGVYYEDGAPVNGFVNCYSKGTKSIDIRSTLNNYVIFNNLPEGNYKYIVIATAKNGNQSAVRTINTSFTVQGKETRIASNVATMQAECTAKVQETAKTQEVVAEKIDKAVNSSEVVSAIESMESPETMVAKEVVAEQEKAMPEVIVPETTVVEETVNVSNDVESICSEVVVEEPVYVDNTPAPSIRISEQNYPSSTHKRGRNFGIRGIVSTDCGVLTSVKGYVYDCYGNVVPGFASEYNAIGSSSFNLRYSINEDLIFNNLPVGEYRYVVRASAANGSKTSELTLIDCAFSVR